jgi:predicted neuraminidase
MLNSWPATIWRASIFLPLLYVTASPAIEIAAQPGYLKAEFIYERAPFEQCHASTIEQTAEGLVAAWFGGTAEGNDDVGIWFARHLGNAWTDPVEVANGAHISGQRYPCWNPVLYQQPQGPLLLFYKVGPSPRAWWGMLIHSADGGEHWSTSRRLPYGALGPIKNKPVLLANGVLLCGSSTEHDGWRVQMEHTRDSGVSFEVVGPLNDGQQFGAIQPTIFQHGGGKLQILCRSRQRVLTECWSDDYGRTWSPMRATDLPNPNAGADGVTLADGRHLLVYNHTQRGRSPLNVAVSTDGKLWKSACVLEDEPGEFSYPAVIQATDGTVHITYTWKRLRVKHVVLDPTRLVLR